MTTEQDNLIAFLLHPAVLPIVLQILQQHPELMQPQQTMAGDVIPFPPSANTPLGRKQIKQELLTGKSAFESALPASTHPPVTIEEIKSRVPGNENEK